MVKPSDNETSEIEILATRKTRTTSGKSQLTWHSGKNVEGDQYIRIWVNSGNGYFSNQWIPVTEIVEILEEHNSVPFSSIIFSDLYLGRSANNCPFLVAVLLDAGMLKLSENTKRKFVYTGAELKIDTAKPRRTVKKAAAKTTAKSAK